MRESPGEIRDAIFYPGGEREKGTRGNEEEERRERRKDHREEEGNEENKIQVVMRGTREYRKWKEGNEKRRAR